MKKIYNWALRNYGADEAIVNAVNMLRSEHAERLVEVIVGCGIDNNEVPQEFVYEGKLYKLVSYNYVLDEITYRCEDSTTRYFPTQMAADAYEMNGDYIWNESSSDPKDEYPFKGVLTRECEHTTWYSRWFEWANKPM